MPRASAPFTIGASTYQGVLTPLKLWTDLDKNVTKVEYPKTETTGMSQSFRNDLNLTLARYDSIAPLWGNRAGIVYPKVYEFCRGVQSLNPDCYLLEYGNPENWAGNIFDVGKASEGFLFRYPTTLGQESNYTNAAGADETWFLHYPGASTDPLKRMYNDGTPANQCFYVGSAGFRAFMLQMIERAVDAGCDGFFFDNAGIQYKISSSFTDPATGLKTNNPQDPLTGATFTIAVFNKQYADMAAAIRAALVAKYGTPPICPVSGKPIIIWANSGEYTHESGGGYDEITAIVDTYKAASAESPGYFAPSRQIKNAGSAVALPPVYDPGRFGPPVDQTPIPLTASNSADTGPSGAKTWRNYVDSMRDVVVARSLPFFFRSKRVDDIRTNNFLTTPWPTTSNGNSRVTFIYGSLLLCGGRPQDGVYVKFTEMMGWWPGFEVDIGVPVEDGYAPSFNGKAYLCSRRFTKAVVIVNPSDITYVGVNPGITGTYRRFLDNTKTEESGGNYPPFSVGPSVSGVLEVRPYSAEILVLDTPVSGTNLAPVVDAGPPQSITLPTAQVTLDGTVTDDGLPDPPAAVITTWSMVSGPAPVTFGNPAVIDTTATFTIAGAYLLRLTASDSLLSSFDDVQITVLAAATISVYANHPRLLYRDTDKTAITARTNSASSWQTLWDGAIKTRADALVTMTPAVFATQTTPHLAMLLLATYGWIEETGMPAGGYKEAARAHALYVAGLPPSSVPLRRSRVPCLAYALDTLHADLSIADRTTLANALLFQCEQLRNDPAEKVTGGTALDQALNLLGSLACYGVIDSTAMFQRALDWWLGTPSVPGHMDFVRYEKDDGGSAHGSWFTYWSGLYPELLFMQAFKNGTDQTPFTTEAPWAEQMWEWLIWSHRGGPEKDHEVYGDTQRQAAVLSNIHRFVLASLIGRYPAPNGSEGDKHLRWLFDEQAAKTPLATTDEQIYQVLLYDPASVAAKAPADATVPPSSARVFDPPGVFYYRQEKRASGDDPWDYDKSVVYRVSTRRRYFLGSQHLDAGSVKIRFKGDPILLSPAGLHTADSFHHDNAYQRTWLQSMAPLIEETAAIYTRSGSSVVNDGGQRFKEFSGVFNPGDLNALLNDGGGEAWRVADTFGQGNVDSHFFFLIANIRDAYKKQSTDPQRATLCNLRYLIIKPSAAIGLDWPALLYYARVQKTDPAAKVTVPFHSASAFTTTAWGFHTVGAGGVGKLWVDVRGIGGYTIVNATPGTDPGDGYGNDQFKPPIAGATNYKPSVAPVARDIPTIKKHSIYLSKIAQTAEEHYVCLLMPTGAADAEPASSRTWVTDASDPIFYGITIGSETFKIHRTLDLAVFGSIDITPPAEVTGLALQARDKSLGVSWSDPADADLAEIRIYKRTSAV